MVTSEAPPTTLSPVGIVELRHRRRDSALAQLIATAVRLGAVRQGELLLVTLQRSERFAASALGKGSALPHARSFAVTRPIAILGRSVRGIDWDGDEKVHLALLVLSPALAPASLHAQRVAAAAHAVRLQRTRQRLLELGEDAAGELLRSELP